MSNRIYTFEEFLKFVGPLIKLQLEIALAPDMNEEDFSYYLLKNFIEGGYYYGKIEGGKVQHFLAVTQLGSDTPLVWILYVDKSSREHSKEILHNMLADLRKLGKKKAQCETTHLTSSYERWIKKFGAKKYSITYRIEL